jgi:uncharacterized protein YlxP (DUF503 family)
MPPPDSFPDFDPSSLPRDADPSLGYTAVIGLLQADLHLPGCRSLKTKRGLLARTLNHLRKQHHLAAAEVARHDIWGRAGIAAVTVSPDRAIAENTLRAAVRDLQRDRDVELLDYSIELL